jgi:hypothetical protein
VGRSVLLQTQSCDLIGVVEDSGLCLSICPFPSRYIFSMSHQWDNLTSSDGSSPFSYDMPDAIGNHNNVHMHSSSHNNLFHRNHIGLVCSFSFDIDITVLSYISKSSMTTITQQNLQFIQLLATTSHQTLLQSTNPHYLRLYEENMMLKTRMNNERSAYTQSINSICIYVTESRAVN